MTTWFTYDFGYSWPYTSGHLLVCLAGVAMLLASRWRAWPGWTLALGGVIAIWGAVGATVMHTAVQINEPARVVTPRFAPPPGGRVLDLGAGSGRGAIGLLLARPDITVAALDRYQGYYGIDDNTPDRLRRNARLAGVEARLSVDVGDMRQLPFDDRSFDAAMSIAAIDHLGWDGIATSLRETARVLKPGGELLIVGLNPDLWVRLAIPSSIHGGYWGTGQDRQRWIRVLDAAGFDVIDAGTRPATTYLLARLRA
ncbi:MAG: class I SAM-dependent methyltransferase [Vicinamibacterales bacterium]